MELVQSVAYALGTKYGYEILLLLSQNSKSTFKFIMESLQIKSSGLLGYHLRKMLDAQIIRKEDFDVLISSRQYYTITGKGIRILNFTQKLLDAQLEISY